MKKRIANWFGLPTKEDIDEIKNLVMASEVITSATMGEVSDLKERFLELKRDMRALYSEVESDIKRVDRKITAVKPILKVQDPEAVAFIKGILSKHDNKMNTQEFQLAESHRSLIALEDKAQKAVDRAADASTKINNVLVGLGLNLNEKEAYSIDNLRNIVIDAKINGESKAV